jgi:hypothetical protein
MFFPPRARLAPGRHHSVTVGGIKLLYPGGFATILASNSAFLPACFSGAELKLTPQDIAEIEGTQTLRL